MSRRRCAIAALVAVAAAAVAAPAAFAGTTSIQGSLSPGDTPSANTIFFGSEPQVPSTCTRVNPKPTNISLSSVNDVYSFWNATNQFQCVTVTLTANGLTCSLFVDGVTASNAYAYATSAFDPASASANWLADSGGVDSFPTQRFGFVVGPFAQFQVVVTSSFGSSFLCPSYSLTVQIGKSSR